MENTENTAKTTTISIPVCKLEKFRELAEKLQKKQRQYGLPALEYTEKERYTTTRDTVTHMVGTSFRDDVTHKIHVEYVTLELRNTSVRKDGAEEYDHIGSISMKDGVMTVSLKDSKYMGWFREYPSKCDHCGTVRKRNCYHVFERDGKPYYIGSTCVKDYFGFDCKALLDMDIQLFFLAGGDYDDEWLRDAEPCISFGQIYHYINRNILTKWAVLKSELETVKWDKEGYYIEGRDMGETYEQVKHHYDDYLKYEDSFRQNCHNVLQRGYCTRQNLKLYACAVYFALADLERSKGNEPLKKTYAKGERITLTAKVERKSFCEGYYGQTTILKLTDADGERYETFTSGGMGYNVREGETITFKGTVDGKKTFKGVESWSLKRCALVTK